MKTFQSRHLQHGSYDPATQELTIIFVNGSAEIRTMVPRIVWDELSKASSPGRYYHSKIKLTYPIKRDRSRQYANGSTQVSQ